MRSRAPRTPRDGTRALSKEPTDTTQLARSRGATEVAWRRAGRCGTESATPSLEIARALATACAVAAVLLEPTARDVRQHAGQQRTLEGERTACAFRVHAQILHRHCEGSDAAPVARRKARMPYRGPPLSAPPLHGRHALRYGAQIGAQVDTAGWRRRSSGVECCERGQRFREQLASERALRRARHHCVLCSVGMLQRLQRSAYAAQRFDSTRRGGQRESTLQREHRASLETQLPPNCTQLLWC